jgi:uroporphyrinogen decarboxylase
LADPRAFFLTDRWAAEKDRLRRANRPLPLYRGQRGPVTLATSLCGAEGLIFLILDRPELAARLRDTIARAMLAKGRVQDEEAGYAPHDAPHGFWLADDNCALLTPAMYEFFGYPILRAVFERYSPDPGDRRFQHSDSDMGHLLPVLARCGLTGVNFGPNLTVQEIRRHMPGTVIHGQLAPFTLSRNEEANIVAETMRDCGMAREARGLVLATAGSVNDGTRLTGMRLAMAAVQRYGRYE